MGQFDKRDQHQSCNQNHSSFALSVQLKSLFIVYPHINTAYKGRTLRSLVQCPIGLTGNEDFNIANLKKL